MGMGGQWTQVGMGWRLGLMDIDPPVVHLLDSEEAPVWEHHYDVGTNLISSHLLPKDTD